MKFLIRAAIALVVLGVIGALTVPPAVQFVKQRNKTSWRFAEVSTGDIVEVVNSTGTVKPVRSVQVGAVVSGPIEELFVEFNEEVEEGQILAKIDPRLYAANVARDEANLLARQAEVKRIEALLNQAENSRDRAINLQKINEEFISDTEMDQYVFNVMSLEAQLELANASILQAEASLANSEANLSYTEITSPIDGIIIDRKIDPGQSLAATFQTPELFVVAPDLRKEIHIFASVDEADIGLIIDAKERNEPVKFTVDAHDEDLFEGVIAEVRFSSTEVQNVVTYPVVVSAANPDLKLLPGMTATLSFQVQERTEVTRIPNEALRFYPKTERVHPDDRGILQGVSSSSDDDDTEAPELSATQKAEASQSRRRRHVWIVEGDYLRAVEVYTGISDNKYTELIEGDLEPGDQLVTGENSSG